MKRIISKLLNHKVIQNILKMMTGTMLGQIISVIMIPIASRLYGAELYGDLAVFTSTSSMCGSFLGFGLAAAIMVEDTDEKAMQTYKLAVILTNVFVVVIVAVVLVLSPLVHIVNTSLPYIVSVLLLAFYIMTTNQINMLYAWLNRKGRYNILLMNPIITPFVNNGLVIFLGLTGFKNIGLYAGIIVSQVVTLIHMFIHMDKISYKFRLKDTATIIKRNKDFILYQYPATFMNSIVGNLPVQILSICFGNTIVGYYSMAMKLLNIPSNIVSNSVSRVYFKEASEKERMLGTAREYTYKVCKLVTAVYCIPVAGILMLGQWVIPFILGSDWTPSVMYIQIMAIWNLFAISINCTSGFSSVIGKQKSNMIISIVKLIVFPISMIGISKLFNSPVLTIWTYALSYSVINVIYYEVLIGTKKEFRFKFLKLGLLFGVGCILMYILSGIVSSLI